MRQAGEVKELAIADLVPNPRNYRSHPASQVSRLQQSLARHGQYRPVVVQASTLKILAGHGVVEAAKQAGETQITATVVDCTDEEALAILVDDNELARHAEDDRESLAELLADLHETEFAPLSYNDDEVEDLLRELTMPRMGEADGLPHQSLVDRFGVPPFSVLDARQGYWQERKRGWLALGLRSELGRGGNLQGMSDSNDEYAYHKQEYFARQGRA